MKRLLAVLSVLGVVASVWGVASAIAHVGEGGPGFLAKEIYGVLGWSLVGALSVGYFWLSQRRPTP